MEIGFESGLQGQRQGLPHLVFLHGAGGRGSVWLGQLSPLGKQWNTIAPDLPGHGNTPGPVCETIEEMADWLDRVLAELGVERFILVGHSMGGALAQTFALAHPGRAEGLVLLSTSARLPVNPKVFQGLETNFEDTAAMLMDWCFAQDDKLMKKGALELMVQAGPEALIADFKACNHFDVQARLTELDLPCLIMTGAEDKMAPPSMAEELNQGLSGSRLEILPGIGHMIHIEAAERVRRALADFATRIWG